MLNPWNTRDRQKRKLLLAEDGTVYKVKRSKMENNVEAGQYVEYRLFVLATLLYSIRNKLFQTLICALIYASKPRNNILLLKSVRFRIRHTLFFALLNNRFIRTVICY